MSSISTLNKAWFYTFFFSTGYTTILPSLQQLYTRGHHCAVDSCTDLLVRMSHYHVKRVKPREWPSVFTTCVTRGALTRPQTQTADHTGSLKQDTLSLKSWTRAGALAKCSDVNQCISAAIVLCKGKNFLHLLHRGHSWLLYETHLLRNGSELLAVMVRASWAIGEDTGFVLPSWSILVGSWFLRASSCGR